MSNIPSSAMPHAFAHEEEDEKVAPTARQAGFSLSGIAVAGAAAALVYFLFVRR